MSKLEIVPWGAGRLRVGAWRGDPEVAQITPAPTRPPTPEAVERCVLALADEGQRAVLTSALTPQEQEPFLAAGFTVHERLHLLRHDLADLPVPAGPPAGARLRRARRLDRARVLQVDGAAFSPFWRFDAQGLDDARRATPSSRYRVAVAGQVVGYAVTGRAGSVGYLQRLAVLPDHQHRGIGTALVVDGLAWARAHGARSLLVNTQESNEGARHLYERLGFQLEPQGLAVLERPLGPAGTSR